MIYTMFSLDAKDDVQEQVSRILTAYIRKHGRPPQIVEVNPDNQGIKADAPVLAFPYVQKQLIYLGEEKEEE